MGAFFSIFFLLTYGDDLKQRRIRIWFIFALSAGAWFVSLPAFATVSVAQTNVSAHAIYANEVTRTSIPITNYTYYYLTTNGSTFNATDSYYNLSTTKQLLPVNTIVFLSPSGGTHPGSTTPAGRYLIAKFVTMPGYPNITNVGPGIYQVHMHASSNSIGGVQLYEQLWIENPQDSNIFMVGQTQLSNQLQIGNAEYTDTFSNNQSIAIPTNDRFALYVFANMTTAASNNNNVTLYFGDGNNPHVSVPFGIPASLNHLAFNNVSSTAMSNTITSYTAMNTSAYSEHPLNQVGFWVYFTFWSFIMAVHALILYLLIMHKFKELANEGLNQADNPMETQFK